MLVFYAILITTFWKKSQFFSKDFRQKAFIFIIVVIVYLNHFLEDLGRAVGTNTKNSDCKVCVWSQTRRKWGPCNSWAILEGVIEDEMRACFTVARNWGSISKSSRLNSKSYNLFATLISLLKKTKTICYQRSVRIFLRCIAQYQCS